MQLEKMTKFKGRFDLNKFSLVEFIIIQITWKVKTFERIKYVYIYIYIFSESPQVS